MYPFVVRVRPGRFRALNRAAHWIEQNLCVRFRRGYFVENVSPQFSQTGSVIDIFYAADRTTKNPLGTASLDDPLAQRLWPGGEVVGYAGFACTHARSAGLSLILI